MIDLAPGVYGDISAAQYFALPYASNSRLSLLKRSPAHLKADIDNPATTTDAQKLGTAAHHAILEPGVFEQRYTLGGSCSAELKSGARKGEPCGTTGSVRVGGDWFCGKHKPDAEPDRVDVLTYEQYRACIGMRDAMQAHPRIRRLLDAEGRNELTVVWDDAETGVRCKARIDRLVTDFGGVVLDVKTTQDARPDEFEWSAFRWGYFRQLGFYQDGLTAHGFQMKHLVIAAVEKAAPWAVMGFRLSDAAADAGREELRILLRRYAECVEKNEWPAYPTDIRELSLPSWAWRKLEDEVEA